ncbi:MAG: hypothetical protein ACMUEM_07460 [Flavobacteriales bacterium AspAUS03]
MKTKYSVVNPHMQADLVGKRISSRTTTQTQSTERHPKLLNELGIKPSAMINISDGLASEILQLCDQSQLG